MLGGGVFVTQNKVLPGSYINFVNRASVSSAIGERGIVALALNLGKSAGKVIEITKSDFALNCKEITGKEYNSVDVRPLREIFCHANKVYVYDGSEAETEAVIKAFEPYEFNVLCVHNSIDETVEAYVTAVKSWRDDIGKKCQVVVDNFTGTTDHEGVINVKNYTKEFPEDDNSSVGGLAPWVAGAVAGCALNASCTNMLYDGELTIIANRTQKELEDCIKNGEFAFHLVYGEIRVLEDINTLKTTTDNKGEDLKANQTIRVIDQIANDIAKLFNTKYLGKIPNTASGRTLLWSDIVKHHRELETIQAIEYFDSSLLTVEQGNTKKSVVVNDAVTVVNSMAQLYMTIVVQ